MIAIVRRFLARVGALFRSRSAETELQREIAAHLRLIEDDYRARGMSEKEARFGAQRAFGGVTQMQERQRETRSFRALFDLGLDLKLGVRMLRKYPGVTLVGGLGIAVAIGIGAATFNGFYTILSREVPLPEGERLVSVLNWSAAQGRRGETRFRDFARWRNEVRSLESVAAFRNAGRNLITPNGAAEPITIAEMTPAGFAAARVPALHGRIFNEHDARPGAPGVLVISHQVWQTRFAGDPAVLGREVRLGERAHTIIGVMPGHALLGAQFTATSMIGMIALAGIIVRNSILLVDFIDTELRTGSGLEDAVMRAGIVRARPIALTGLAAMIGAFFILDDPIFNGLAVSLIFGILISTVLTLLVIPVLYYAYLKRQPVPAAP